MNLISCGENSLFNSSSKSRGQNGVQKWDSDQFPLKIKISEEFTESEHREISDVGSTWDQSHGGMNFFQFSKGKAKNASSLDHFNDNVLGIYKMTRKLPKYPSRTLAITQIYADRMNYGGKSYLAIRHADIIVNYAEFSFSSNSSFGSYDLPTVILHELGHFIGLNHYTKGQEMSIMAPSIDSYTQIHQPFQKDTELVQKLYEDKAGQGQQVQGRSIASLSTSEDYSKMEKPVVEERGIRIIHLLTPDYRCKHIVDGKVVHEHAAHPAQGHIFK